MQNTQKSFERNGHSASRRATLAAIVTLVLATPALGQTIPPVATTTSLSGPRFGITFLPEGVVEKLQERSIEIQPTISQFGWQFEKQFYSKEGGVTAITEWVALVGGLEQGVVIPSVTWLVGIRMRDGAEFGVGPNITPAGTALAIAAGVTFRAGALNVPVNFAVVPSKSGVRFSVLSGFSLRTRH